MRFPALLLLALSLFALTSCEDGNGSNPYADHLASDSAPSQEDPAATSSIVGTWSLKSSENSWFVHFAKDGSWVITDDKEGAKQRVYGTYSVQGDQFTGPMKNPGVGTGKISGSFSANTISLYFTEYWHDPHKTVHYTGSR